MIRLQTPFRLTEVERKKILERALSRGGDFAEIFAEYRLFSFINMEEEIIKETAESVSLGLGIRVISGEKTGYGYTNDFSLETINKAALTAAAIADSSREVSLPKFHRSPGSEGLYPLGRPAHEASLKDKIGLVRRAYLACQKADPKIKKVKVLFQDHVQSLSVVNSEGQIAEDTRPQVKLVCTAVAENGRRGSRKIRRWMSRRKSRTSNSSTGNRSFRT